MNGAARCMVVRRRPDKRANVGSYAARTARLTASGRAIGRKKDFG